MWLEQWLFWSLCYATSARAQHILLCFALFIQILSTCFLGVCTNNGINNIPFFSCFYFYRALVQILYLMFKATKSKLEIIFTDSKYKIQSRCKNDVVFFGGNIQGSKITLLPSEWHISTSKYILIVLSLSHLIWNLFLNPNLKSKQWNDVEKKKQQQRNHWKFVE